MSGSDEDIQWFIARDGKQHGPVSDLELKKIIELSHLKPTDLVWRQGFTDWRAASSVFPQLSAPAPAAAPAANAPATAASAATSPAAASVKADPPGRHAASPAAAQSAPAQKQSTGLAAQDSRRPQGATAHGGEPAATRPLGTPTARPGDSFSAAPGPSLGTAGGPAAATAHRLTTDSRKPSELAAHPRTPSRAPSRGRRIAVIAAGLVAMTGVGAWLSSQYTDDVFTYMLFDDGADTETGPATANLAPSVAPPQPPAPQQPPAAAPVETAAIPTTEDIDRRLQGRAMWVAVKQEFPDWYQTRVAEVARLTAQNTEQSEITRYLISELVVLRRENAQHALAASTSRHKELATAFLANLNRLSQENGDGCYDFISKGESSPTIVARLDDPAKSTEIEAQVVAIVGAIVEGRRQPAEHAAPIKTDYDVLAGELGRLGWTQADMQLFANPKALAQAPRSRVCNMLKDWFTAHLAIEDPSTQERLLFETLKPVISG